MVDRLVVLEVRVDVRKKFDHTNTILHSTLHLQNTIRENVIASLCPLSRNGRDWEGETKVGVRGWGDGLSPLSIGHLGSSHCSQAESARDGIPAGRG